MDRTSCDAGTAVSGAIAACAACASVSRLAVCITVRAQKVEQADTCETLSAGCRRAFTLTDAGGDIALASYAVLLWLQVISAE
jgi:hypothetical protein